MADFKITGAMRLMTDPASQQLTAFGAKATQTFSKVSGALSNAISAATVGLFAGLSFARKVQRHF